MSKTPIIDEAVDKVKPSSRYGFTLVNLCEFKHDPELVALVISTIQSSIDSGVMIDGKMSLNIARAMRKQLSLAI